MTADGTPAPNAAVREPARPAAVAVLTGLLLAPLAWLAQMVIAETLAAQSCYPLTHPLPTPLVSWLRPALVTISGVCLVAGVTGTLVAWRTIRRMGSANWRQLKGERRTRAELDWFLSRVAFMCSTLFLFALVATDVALAIVSPCRGW